MPGDGLRFYGTTGTGGGADGDSEPDPNNWLGRFRAAETLHEFQSTLTSAQTARTGHIVFDTTRIGDGADVHALKWLLMQTGPAALTASRIMAFDSVTGGFKLERRFPALAGIGDDYAVFDRENVFPNVTIAQARNGDQRFRCIALRNEHGGIVTNVKFYFTAIGSSGQRMSRFHQGASPAIQPFLQRADGVTDLFDAFGQRDPLGGPDNFVDSGAWLNPQTFPIADVTVGSIGVNGVIAIWLRRIIPENLRLRNSTAIMIVAETDVGGSDPDPLIGAAIIPYDIDGETPAATLEIDRFVHIQGGGRLLGTVTNSAGGIRDRPVRFGIRAGDLGTIATDDDPTTDFDVTDEDGVAFGTFFASVDPADEGALSHPQVVVGAGDEVGDP